MPGIDSIGVFPIKTFRLKGGILELARKKLIIVSLKLIYNLILFHLMTFFCIKLKLIYKFNLISALQNLIFIRLTLHKVNTMK